jgi:hypothetical protein
MSLHINRFIDAIKATESKSQRDLIMSISDAKALHAEITKLLLALHELHEKTVVSPNTVVSDIEVDGGSF